jgi:hypothetical protein
VEGVQLALVPAIDSDGAGGDMGGRTHLPGRGDPGRDGCPRMPKNQRGS